MVANLDGLGESCMLQVNRDATMKQISSDDFVKSIKPQDILDMGR